MASRIEDIINEIERYIDEESKPAAFSTNKIIINRDDLDSLLQELRLNAPEEIKKYQKIISNKEQIIADARAKADEIISAAQIETNKLVSEHQIMQNAYAQANQVVLVASKTAQETVDRATEDANNIRMGAIQYTDELLANIQSILANSIDTTRARNDNFLATMQTYLDTVEQNRAALVPDQIKAADEVNEGNAKAEMNSHTASASASSSEDDVPPLDIPEQFFNKD